MIHLLTSPELKVFSILFAFVGLLIVMELVLMLVGVSSDLGLADAGSPGLEAEGFVPDSLLSGVDSAALHSLDPAAMAESPGVAATGAASFLAALGLGQVPSVLWLAILCGTISAQGFCLQIVLSNLTGGMLPGWLAVGLTLPGAFWATRRLSRLIGRLVPQTESYAIAASGFNRRRGTVTVGTAREGTPAEVRFTDGYGTLHYVMAEPLDPKDAIAAGTEVAIFRARDGKPRILALQ